MGGMRRSLSQGPHLGGDNRKAATLLAGAAYVVAVAIVMLVLPTVDETPGPLEDAAGTIVFPGFPAADLYEFRLFALGTQVIIWTTIGLAAAAMLSRLLDTKRTEQLTAS